MLLAILFHVKSEVTVPIQEETQVLYVQVNQVAEYGVVLFIIGQQENLS